MAMSGAERIALFRKRKAEAGQTMVWTAPLPTEGEVEPAVAIAQAWQAAVTQLLDVRKKAVAWIRRQERQMEAQEAAAKKFVELAGETPEYSGESDSAYRRYRAARKEYMDANVTITKRKQVSEAEQKVIDDAETMMNQIGDLSLNWLKKGREPQGRASRAERWQNAVGELQGLIDEYQTWRDSLPENFQGTALAEKLDAIVGIDLGELDGADLPIGWGSD
jgi:hypothetical protein